MKIALQSLKFWKILNKIVLVPENIQTWILSSDGKYILSCNKDGNNVAIIDLEKEEVVLSIPFENVSGVDNL